jgi:cellobiose-specific phosphotransferase system component IIA
MANESFQTLSAELQTRINNLPILSGRNTVAEVVAAAVAETTAAAPDTAALQAQAAQASTERDGAVAALTAVVEKFEAFAAASKAQLDEARNAVEQAKTELAEAQKAIPAQVTQAVSQGVTEGLAACAIPANDLPSSAAVEPKKLTRDELDKSMEGKPLQERVALLKEFRGNK